MYRATGIMRLLQYSLGIWKLMEAVFIKKKEENVLNICFHKALWVKGGTAGNYPIYESNHIS